MTRSMSGVMRGQNGQTVSEVDMKLDFISVRTNLKGRDADGRTTLENLLCLVRVFFSALHLPPAHQCRRYTRRLASLPRAAAQPPE